MTSPWAADSFLWLGIVVGLVGRVLLGLVVQTVRDLVVQACEALRARRRRRELVGALRAELDEVRA